MTDSQFDNSKQLVSFEKQINKSFLQPNKLLVQSPGTPNSTAGSPLTLCPTLGLGLLRGKSARQATSGVSNQYRSLSKTPCISKAVLGQGHPVPWVKMGNSTTPQPPPIGHLNPLFGGEGDEANSSAHQNVSTDCDMQ